MPNSSAAAASPLPSTGEPNMDMDTKTHVSHVHGLSYKFTARSARLLEQGFDLATKYIIGFN